VTDTGKSRRATAWSQKVSFQPTQNCGSIKNVQHQILVSSKPNVQIARFRERGNIAGTAVNRKGWRSEVMEFVSVWVCSDRCTVECMRLQCCETRIVGHFHICIHSGGLPEIWTRCSLTDRAPDFLTGFRWFRLSLLANYWCFTSK